MSEDRPEEFHEASDLACDVLVVVVNKTEREQFVSQAQECFDSLDRLESVKTGYRYVSVVNEHSQKLRMIQVGEGLVGEQAAIIKIYTALLEVRPKYLVMVGMAFGYPNYGEINENGRPNVIEISVGDVILSQGIIFYDQKEVYGDHCLPRYRYQAEKLNRAESDRVFLRSFQSVAEERMQDLRVHVGWMITGSSYIASSVYRDHLRSLLREKLKCNIIGGDMEGGAILSIPKKDLPPWLVVKGVSDHADGQTRVEHKERACRNASRLVLQWFGRLGGMQDIFEMEAKGNDLDKARR